VTWEKAERESGELEGAEWSRKKRWWNNEE